MQHLHCPRYKGIHTKTSRSSSTDCGGIDGYRYKIIMAGMDGGDAQWSVGLQYAGRLKPLK